MKRWLYGVMLLILIIAAGTGLTEMEVRADVLWEPYGNEFYREHMEDMTHVERVYIANGPDGKVITYESPLINREVETWDNGTAEYILFTYEDENRVVWGVYEDGSTTGWVPMEYMVARYDSLSFQEEYAEKIESEYGRLGEGLDGEEIYLWSYPGADNYTMIILQGDYYPEWSAIFVDEEGRRWGHISYYYGLRDKWLCLDDRAADYAALYPNGGPDRVGEIEPYVSTGTRIVPGGIQMSQGIMSKGMIVITIIIVVAVVVVTAVLLVLLKRKKVNIHHE